MKASDFVRARDVEKRFMLNVERAVRDYGGTDEHLYRLAKDETLPAIKDFAKRHVGPAEGWHHINSNFTSAVEAIDATECPVRWGFAKNPAEIPMICQPVDHLVKPTPLNRRMTSPEVYAQYAKMADPNKLFTFGARVQAFQLNQLVFTLWMFNGQLWFASLGTFGEQRDVLVDPVHPDVVWLEGRCVLVCE